MMHPEPPDAVVGVCGFGSSCGGSTSSSKPFYIEAHENQEPWQCRWLGLQVGLRLPGFGFKGFLRVERSIYKSEPENSGCTRGNLNPGPQAQGILSPP